LMAALFLVTIRILCFSWLQQRGGLVFYVDWGFPRFFLTILRSFVHYES